MQERDDNFLLREYAEHGSDEAFAELTARHVNKVYSVALRQTGNVHQAEEITQAVFVILAKKSRGLGKGVILSGWLYQAARLTSVTFLRSEIRRSRREQEAHMQTLSNESDTEAWPQIAPLLDDAMGALNEDDRQAIVLRFFDQKNLKEVGQSMGASEDAAKKRVTRALEKLRKYFARRRVNSTTAIIAAAISANSVQVAPVGLAKAAASLALAKSVALGGSTLIKGALKVMFWTKAKTAVVVGAGILLAAGGAVVVQRVAVAQTAPAQTPAPDPAWANDPKSWELNSRTLQSLPPSAFILRTTQFSRNGGGVGAGGRRLMRSASVQSLIAEAYNFSELRMVLPSDMPTERFDFLSTMSIDWKPELRDQIQKRFLLVAHKENREMDVFRLRVKNPNPPNLKKHVRVNEPSSWTSNVQSMEIQNQSVDGFIGSIESNMGQPVLDETGLSGNYDFQLDWKPKPGESVKDAFRRALSEQLGLELVPDRAPIEELVVEKLN